jgi:hypothetical protein
MLSNKNKKFDVWKDKQGRWCVGNECFSMKATDEGVRVKYNPNSKGCPKNLNEAMSSLMDVVRTGKPTTYVKPLDD